MASFTDIVGTFIVMGLLVFAMLSFIIIVQGGNGAPQPIAENSLLNESFSDLEESLGGLEDTSNSQFEQFNAETPVPGFGSIVLFGIVSAGKTFSRVTVATFSIIVRLPLIMLGIPQTIASTIFTWLIIILLAALWILYKLGG